MVVLLSAVAAPRAVAAPVHYLTVSGSRNTVVDVRLPAVELRYDSIDVRTRGGFAGLYLEPRFRERSPESGSGAFVAPFAHVPGYPQGSVLGLAAGDYCTPDQPECRTAGPGTAWAMWRRRLPAGTYRLHLLADQPVTIRLPVTGMSRDLTIRPVRPGADMVRTATADGPTPGNAFVTNLRIETEARERTVYFVQDFVIGTPATAEEASQRTACIRVVQTVPDCPRPFDSRPAFQGFGYGDSRSYAILGPTPIALPGDGQTYTFGWAGYKPSEFGRATIEAVAQATTLNKDQYATLALVGIGLDSPAR
jgi:hypothetical protein